MELLIKKRTGELVPFDKEKIQTAICKAWHDVYPTETGMPSYCIEIANLIESVAIELSEPMDVEDIPSENLFFLLYFFKDGNTV